MCWAVRVVAGDGVGGLQIVKSKSFTGKWEALEGFKARECRGQSHTLEVHSGGRVVNGLEGQTPLGSFRGKNLSKKLQEPGSRQEW